MKENPMPGALTSWEPLTELGELRSRLDRMFDERWDRGALHRSDTAGERTFMPAIDVVRDNGKLLLRADVPGIKPEEVKIEVEGDVLTVSGSHEQQEEHKGKQFLRRERRYGSFSRSLALPPGVEAKKIKSQDPRRRRRGDDPATRATQEGEDQHHADRRQALRASSKATRFRAARGTLNVWPEGPSFRVAGPHTSDGLALCGSVPRLVGTYAVAPVFAIGADARIPHLPRKSQPPADPCSPLIPAATM
jgi:HSP20 family protein